MTAKGKEMNDKSFLQYALEQSFLHPYNNAAESVVLHRDASWSDAYMYADKKHPDIVPYRLAFANMRKYSKQVGYDIKHTLQLYEEYEQYKHDLAENIIIPEKIPEAVATRQTYDLVTANRQSAQKKRIVATLIPSSFSLQLKKIHLQYQGILGEAELELQKNLAAVNLSRVQDFEQIYNVNMRRFNWLHPLYRLNRKRMKLYLNEAAQILKSNYPLDDDFCLSHCFYEFKFFGKNVAKTCSDTLFNLISQLRQMAQPELLNIVQARLVSRDKYATCVKKYIADNNIATISKVTEIRNNMKELFDGYAFLCYLDGVRFAFENKYLNECPEPRHPPLPTVAPLEELKTVSKIVTESYKIDASSGKVGNIYTEALKSYQTKYNELHKLISISD